MNRDDKERLTHFAVFVLFGQIMFVAYCVYNLLIGDLLLASLIFVAITSLMLGWLLLCHLPLGRLVYRACAVIYGGMLLYMMVLGGEGGSKSLWMITFPMYIVLLVGKKEGLFWTALLMAAAMFLIFVPLPGIHPFPYSNDFIVRFVSVYLVVAATVCWYEHFRAYHRAIQAMEMHRLGSLIDGLPDAVRLDDSAGRPLLCNPAYLAMTGLSRDEVFDQELIDGPETPGDMDLCTIPLPGKAGESYRLLLWRKHQNTGSPGTPLPTIPRETAARVSHRDQAASVAPAPAAFDGDLATSPTPTAHPPPVTILLAEDDPMLRQLCTQMLASLGYQVMVAADGEEALDLYRAHQQGIGLILCDQWMPRLNGWQLLTSLRTISPSVPVIMISGAAASPTEGPEHTEQPNAYLIKPYDMGVLQRTIQQVLQNGQTPTT